MKKEKEYEFIKDKERWVHAYDGKEFKVAKAVYCSFINNDLDLFDISWDVEYIDGNPKNCAADNLKLKA